MTGASTHGAPKAGADALFFARAVLADLADFDDATILDACTLIFDHPETPEDLRAEAAEVWAIVIGRAA